MTAQLFSLIWADFIEDVYTLTGGVSELAALFGSYPGLNQNIVKDVRGLVSSYGNGSPTVGSYPVAAAGALGQMQSRSTANNLPWSTIVAYKCLSNLPYSDFPIFGGSTNFQRIINWVSTVYPAGPGAGDLIFGDYFNSSQVAVTDFVIPYQSTFEEPSPFRPPPGSPCQFAMSWDGAIFAIAFNGAVIFNKALTQNPLYGLGIADFSALEQPGSSGNSYFFDLYAFQFFSFYNGALDTLNINNPSNGLAFASFPGNKPGNPAAGFQTILTPPPPTPLVAVPCCAQSAPCL